MSKEVDLELNNSHLSPASQDSDQDQQQVPSDEFLESLLNTPPPAPKLVETAVNSANLAQVRRGKNVT